MLLVVDVGNTNIVLGVYEGKEIMAHWRISTDRGRTTDEYGMLLSNLFLHDPKVNKEDVEAVIISSVVPPLRSIYLSLGKCVCAIFIKNHYS